MFQFYKDCTNLFSGGTRRNLYETLIAALSNQDDFVLINTSCTGNSQLKQSIRTLLKTSHKNVFVGIRLNFFVQCIEWIQLFDVT